MRLGRVGVKRIAQLRQPRGEFGRKHDHGLVLPFGQGLPLGRGGFTIRGRFRRQGAELQLQQPGSLGTRKQAGRKLVVVHQRRQAVRRRQAEDQDLRRSLAHELRHLQKAHAQQRVEHQRQHRDHEQRPPIAQLIANLALEDQLDLGPVHRGRQTLKVYRLGNPLGAAAFNRATTRRPLTRA